MKRNYMLMITMLLLAFFSATVGYAQVSLTATGGTLTGSYTTTKEAFDAINAGTHTGTIAITVTGTVTETASAVLNSSTAPASYAAVSIQPSGVSTITGYLVGGHLIDLNGADNVTIDGLNTGGNSLTISNTALGTSTAIRFYNDATNNLVQNCSLLASTGASFGVVYFGGGLVTGNDNNTVTYCNIGPAGADLPLNGIYSMGTSSAIDNSDNTISNSNIYNYFNASSSTSGMNINSGNSAWIITNNRLFQTANRIYTAAATHYGIFITSGSSYTIANNTIGFASADESGTTNMIGLTSGSLGGTFPSAYTAGGVANATRYIAISGAFTAGGAASSIQNNTIAGFALYTSSGASSTYGILCGISVTSGNVNIGTVAGNNIGTKSGSLYSACTTSAGMIAGIYVTSANTVVIKNNTIQNLDAMGTSATTSGGINGINTEGTLGTILVAGNTIGGTTYPNLRMGNLTTGANLSNVGTTFGPASGSCVFQGIRNANTGVVNIGASDIPNTIQNAYANSTSTTGSFLRGIYCAAGSVNVSYNTLSNLASASGVTSFSNGGVGAIGIYIYTCVAPVISNNTISGIMMMNTGTGGYNLAGISYTGPGTSMTISKNKIFNLSNASTSVSATAPGTATGIFIRDGFGVPTSIDNNMISLGNGQTTNTAFIGIWGQYGAGSATTYKMYYNTINIEGTVASGAQPSFCFQRGDFSATAVTPYIIDAKNNLFTNTRSGGTGKHFAISNNYPVVTSSATNWAANASNYNVLNGNAATIGYWSGEKTFAAWKVASSCDPLSLSGVAVTFNNTATGDLLLNMGITPTTIESGGVVLTGYTTDYEGNTRPGPMPSYNGGGTFPDIGADEFDGVPLDLFPPTISYTPLPHTMGTGIRTLYATISDANGVPTTPFATGLPMLYWRIGLAAYTGVQGVFVSGNTYSFDFGGGVSLGDVVSYYIVAQDLTTPPNVGGYPSGGSGYTADPPTAATPTATPSAYTITAAPLSGDYTVGLTGFSKATGKNIYFEKVTTKVMKEVFVEDPAEEAIHALPVVDKSNAAVSTVATPEPAISSTAKGRMVLREVEEVTWVPMENGVLYTGPLSATISEDPQHLSRAPIAGVYATITAAIADLNLRGVSGNVRFLLNDVSYTIGETFPLLVNIGNVALPTASATVTVKPNTGIISLIQCPLATAGSQIFHIRNSYVMIDGSNTIGGTSRDLTMENLYPTGPQVIRISSTGTTPITNVTVKNSTIINGSNGSSAVVTTDIAGTAGYFNNITIQNNSVQKAYIGIYFLATVAAGNGSGTLVTGNDLNTAGTNSIRLVAIYAQGVDGATVSSNNIGNIVDANAESPKGIWFATGTNSGTISGNTISTITLTNTGAFAVTGIYLSPGTSATNITVTNNAISSLTNSGTTLAFAGILSFSPNTSITHNTVSGLTQNGAAGFWGIVQSGAVNSSCSGNTVSGLLTATSGTPMGINIQGVATGVTVSKNKVSNVKNTNSGGWGSCGMILSSTSTAANILVVNNFISDVTAYGYTLGAGSTDNGYGLIVTSGAGYQIYFNSVSMNTDQTVDGLPAAFNVTSGVTVANALDVRNNIFASSQTIGVQRYAIYSGAASTVFSAIDNNDYFTTGANLGYMTTANVLDLAAWKTATGKDANSVFGDPKFMSLTNLDIQPAVYSPIRNAGVTISGIPDDYHGTTRLSPPDIGAYEDGFAQLSVNGNVTPVLCFGGSDGAISTVVSGGLPSYSYMWSNGETTSFLSGWGAGPYSVTVTDANYSVATGSWIIVQPTEIELTYTIVDASCPTGADGSITLGVSGGTPDYTFSWGNGAVTQNISGLNPGTYSVAVTDANGCQKTGSYTVGQASAVCDNITVTGFDAGPNCYNAVNTITVAGGATTYTVQASSGDVTFIAGHNILFEPGTKVEPGAKMVGKISTTYCPAPAAPMTAAVAAGTEEAPMNLSNTYFTLYPNPTNGNFTLVQKGEAIYGTVKVDVYSMSGEKVMTEQMVGEKKHEFRFSDIPVGLYFVRVVADNYVETIKLIKTR